MMKRIIPLILAMLLVLPALGQTVSLPHKSDVPPGPVSVDLNMSGFTEDISGISLFIDYDLDVLTYTGHQSDITSGILTINPDYNGMMAISWAHSDGADIDGTFLTLDFDYNGNFYTELQFVEELCEIVYDNLAEVVPEYSNGSISPLMPDGFMEMGSVANAIPGNQVSLPLNIWNDDPGTDFLVNSMSLYIEYNPKQLTYRGITNNIYGVTIDPSSDGMLKLTWADTDGVDFAADETNPFTILTFSFDYLGGGIAPVTFQSNSTLTEDFDILKVQFIDGEVAPDDDLEERAIIGDVNPCEEQYVDIPLQFESMPDVASFDLVIGFDPAVVQYNNVINLHPGLGILNASLNQAGNIITLSWVSPGNDNVDLNGKLADIQFEYVFDTEDDPPPGTVFDTQVSFLGGSIVRTIDTEPVEMSFINGSITHSRALEVSVFLEGLYDGGSTMKKAQDHDGNDPFDKFPGNVADHITIELRNAADYNDLIWSKSEVELLTDGTALVQVPYNLDGDYWLTIKHRNHLETVSAQTISMDKCIVVYDFTDEADKAYGDNQKDMGGGVFALFAGDVNQDGLLTLGDMVLVNGDLRNNLTGYRDTDVNGDGVISTADLIMINRNVRSNIEAITPP